MLDGTRAFAKGGGKCQTINSHPLIISRASIQMAEEKFILIGTPMDDASNKFVPVWKQEAVDERGSKRFHGAFTGGFSAGYFNTVGSKEGT